MMIVNDGDYGMLMMIDYHCHLLHILCVDNMCFLVIYVDYVHYSIDDVDHSNVGTAGKCH